MKASPVSRSRPHASATHGSAAKGKARSSPERSTRLETAIADQVEELEAGIEEDDDGMDDAESFDPVAEYGFDPQFDDRDPSESGGVSNWDGLDTGDEDPGGFVPGTEPDVTISPIPGGFTIALTHVHRGKPLASDVEDESALERICREIVLQQREFVATGDESRRRSLTQAALAEASGVNPGTVSRLVKNRTAELPSGDVVTLESLLESPGAARARFIAGLLREVDAVERDSGGTAVAVMRIAAKGEIVARMQQAFGSDGTSEASVRRMMSECDIPVDPKERERRYLDGSDWWR